MQRTYAELKQVIESGESVLVGGKIVSRIQDLPPITDMVTDPSDLKTELEKVRRERDESAKTAKDLEAKIAELNKKPAGPAAQ